MRWLTNVIALMWIPTLGVMYSGKGTEGWGNGGVTVSTTLVVLGLPALISAALMRKNAPIGPMIVVAQFLALLATIRIYQWSECIMDYDIFARVMHLHTDCVVEVPYTGGGLWAVTWALSFYATLTFLSDPPTPTAGTS